MLTIIRYIICLILVSCSSNTKKCLDKETQSTCNHEKNQFPSKSELGEWNYCTKEFGYILGKSGVKSLEDCPEQLKGNFLEGYSQGRKEDSLIHFKKSQLGATKKEI